MSGDLLWNDVGFIFGWEGADGTTPSPEESINAHSLTYTNQAQVDTAEFKYDSSALLLDGSQDKVEFGPDASLVLGNKDFTIETNVRFNTIASDFNTMASNYVATLDRRGWYFTFNGVDNTLLFVYNTPSGSAGDSVAFSSSWSPSLARFYHVAISRNAGTLYLHIDGAISATDGGTIGTSTIFNPGIETVFGILNPASGQGPLDGWIDESRMTIGTARYGASSFTTLTSPFPRGPFVADPIVLAAPVGFTDDLKIKQLTEKLL